MSLPVFSAKLTVKTSTLVGGYTDRWEVFAKFMDMEGTWYASNVQAGDLVFLDTIGDVPVGGSVSRYEVVSVTSVNTPAFNDIVLVIKYADQGTPVDPTIAIDQESFICRKSTNASFGWMASAEVQLIPGRLVAYARNKDMCEILDPLLTTKMDRAVPFWNQTGTTVFSKQIVMASVDDANSVATANATSLATCEGIIGSALADIPDGEQGYVFTSGVMSVIPSAPLVLGKRVYMSMVDGMVTPVAPSASGSVIFLLGIAVDTDKILWQPHLEAVN